MKKERTKTERDGSMKIASLIKKIVATDTTSPRSYSEKELTDLQSEVYKITGKGEVMGLFNKLQGISA